MVTRPPSRPLVRRGGHLGRVHGHAAPSSEGGLGGLGGKKVSEEGGLGGLGGKVSEEGEVLPAWPAEAVLGKQKSPPGAGGKPPSSGKTPPGAKALLALGCRQWRLLLLNCDDAAERTAQFDGFDAAMAVGRGAVSVVVTWGDSGSGVSPLRRRRRGEGIVSGSIKGWAAKSRRDGRAPRCRDGAAAARQSSAAGGGAAEGCRKDAECHGGAVERRSWSALGEWSKGVFPRIPHFVVGRRGVVVYSGMPEGRLAINVQVTCQSSEHYTILARRQRNLYTITSLNEEAEEANAIKLVKGSLKQWHCWLGHPGSSTLAGMQRTGAVLGMEKTSRREHQGEERCQWCQQAKQTREAFSKERRDRENQQVLLVVSSDLCGPLTAARDGSRYSVTYTDEASNYTVLVNLKSNADTLKSFKDVLAWMKRAAGQKLKGLRSDGGGEYTSITFKKLFREQGIDYFITAPSTHQDNGGGGKEEQEYPGNNESY
ncbi:MAG: hypothetical protein BJ554DRAFT_3056 [Olpidium bornovanus]|uniref:Integrase catalytic domain-containing protein n=1 Tax=Olpidium bornovanus TaxID=278681 RepID=A0A8H8A0T4_9FUNG|nr:MAG: hypothetical protein BJ554DRAFT_3056 [Olpidium bornovanus]